MSDLEKLKKSLTLWLERHGLLSEIKFYSQKEWKAREEDYNNEADLILAGDGSFFEMLNGYYGEEFVDQFDEMVESFGYYLELGNFWNGGFYKIPDYDQNQIGNKSYSEKLRDYRWKQKREKVINRSNSCCEDCGKYSNLEVHHTFYSYGNEPWQYSLDSLRGLCRKCHEKRGELEKVFRLKLAGLTITDIQGLERIIDDGMYWYSKEKVIEFLNSFGPDSRRMKEKFQLMIESKRETED